MDQGTATVLAALIGVAGVVLAGLGGVWIGGRISAGAAKEAAKIAADAAHESSVLSWGSAKEDREEARAARFADRVRELAGLALTRGNLHALLWYRAMFRVVARGNIPELPREDWEFSHAIAELQLLVRLQPTYAAVVRLEQARTDLLYRLDLEDLAPDRPEADQMLKDWLAYYRAWESSAVEFEDAIRAELDRAPIDRTKPMRQGEAKAIPQPNAEDATETRA